MNIIIHCRTPYDVIGNVRPIERWMPMSRANIIQLLGAVTKEPTYSCVSQSNEKAHIFTLVGRFESQFDQNNQTNPIYSVCLFLLRWTRTVDLYLLISTSNLKSTQCASKARELDWCADYYSSSIVLRNGQNMFPGRRPNPRIWKYSSFASQAQHWFRFYQIWIICAVQEGKVGDFGPYVYMVHVRQLIINLNRVESHLSVSIFCAGDFPIFSKLIILRFWASLWLGKPGQMCTPKSKNTHTYWYIQFRLDVFVNSWKKGQPNRKWTMRGARVREEGSLG